MSNEMPKFDFSGASIGSDAELDEALKSEANTDRRFEPGKYEVEIENVTYHAKGKNDDTWTTLAVELRGTGDRKIRTFVLVPSRDLRYGPKKTLFPFKNLQSFCSALGAELKRENAEQVLKQLFSKFDTLKGARVSIELGFKKGFVKYIGKNSEGANQYHLHTQDGNVVCASNDQPIVFADFAAAAEHAKQNSIEIEDLSVTRWAPSASGSGIKVGAKGGW